MDSFGPGYRAASTSDWQGRSDSLTGERFFQKVQVQDLQSATEFAFTPSITIAGFCSDTGIIRNQGRPGAKEGPQAIRRELAKLPYHNTTPLLDVGDIVCLNDKLEQAQEAFAALIQFCHQQHCKTLALGGGHEIAWAHFLGLSACYPAIGIINFDAHFDLRPLPLTNQVNSGTSFKQIYNYYQKQQQAFNYCCLGIQPHANTANLFSFAKNSNTLYLTAEEMNHSPLAQQIQYLQAFLNTQTTIYLSICLDVFAESYAPGVSAPQSLGLLPWQALPLLKYILQSGKVVGLDIAELSPRLDCKEKTARLAAMITAELLELYIP